MRALLLILLACGPVEVAERDCPAGTCLEAELGTTTVGPGEEIDGLCMSWTIGNDEPLYANAVTAENDGWFHHSNWFWVPEEDWDLSDGAWDCGANGFSELEATLRGGVLFAQSTQLEAETQAFLPGYAIEIPPRSRVIANAHVLNWSAEKQTTSLRTRLDLVARKDLIAALAPWRFTYFDLDIPAQSETEHAATCEVRPFYESLTGRDFDLRVHYVLPHFHGLGQGFTATIAGGPQDGEPLIELRDAWGHAFGTTFSEPVDLSDADGLRFGCEHVNDTAADVGWGIGDQEMCVALLFVEGGAMLDTTVRDTTEMGTTGTGLSRSGDCSVLGAPFEVLEP